MIYGYITSVTFSIICKKTYNNIIENNRFIIKLFTYIILLFFIHLYIKLYLSVFKVYYFHTSFLYFLYICISIYLSVFLRLVVWINGIVSCYLNIRKEFLARQQMFKYTR